MTKTTLCLVRHGETETNVRGVLHEHGDVEKLTARGIEQVKLVAQELKSMGLQALYCSNEARAIESAQLISSETGIDAKILDGIEERNWGEFSGKPYSEIKPMLDGMTLEERYTFVPPGGESWKEAEERLISAVQKVTEENIGKVIAIVTHGGSIRILMPHMLGAPLEETYKHDPRNASLSVFDIEGGTITVVEIDDISHLTYER